MWKKQLREVGLLYSLADDLTLFWQLQKLEWEKISQKVDQAVEEDRRAHEAAPMSAIERLSRILQNNEDYAPLRARLEEQLPEALAIAAFLGFKQVEALASINFQTPLLDSNRLENAIAEADALARYAQRCRYWIPTIRAFYHTIAQRLFNASR